MKPEAAARQVIEGKDQKQKLMELMWKRLGKELIDQLRLLLEPLGISDDAYLQKLATQIINR